MNDPESSKKRWKKWFLLALVFLFAVAAMELLVRNTLHNRPERVDAEQLLQTNSQVRSYFGAPIQAKYLKKGSSRTVLGSGSSRGRYQFSIEGSQRSGYIELRWTRASEAAPIEVTNLTAREHIWSEPKPLNPT